MSYATESDVRRWLDEDVLIQLTDDDDTGTVNTTLVSEALDEAAAMVDGYVGSRYALPLATVPAILTRFCADLAICSLFDRRVGRPDHWQARCTNAHKFLEQVAKGLIKLGPDDPAGTGPADTVQVGANPALFPADELARY